MHLAPFDPDPTRPPIHSDDEWSRLPGRIGALDGEAHGRRNRRSCRDPLAGTLDVEGAPR